MATLLEPKPCCEAAPPRPGRAMTRCECADLPFAEIAHRMRHEGQTLAEMGRRTGCGQTCTACLPDLEEYLARHRR
jgi:bacterioferritin-associated ferredoxin